MEGSVVDATTYRRGGAGGQVEKNIRWQSAFLRRNFFCGLASSPALRHTTAMKITILCLLSLALVCSAVAADKPALDNRIRKLTAKFEAMQDNPAKRIPAETLRKAEGLVLLDRTKAGFIFAFQGGGGLALMKDPKSRKWGPAAFLSATEASLGFQVGGQQSFIVLLLMNTNATRSLIDGAIDFGGEANARRSSRAMTLLAASPIRTAPAPTAR